MTTVPMNDAEEKAPGTKERKPATTDPTLRLAAKLDRLMAEIDDEAVQQWALCWLVSKYANQEFKFILPASHLANDFNDRM